MRNIRASLVLPEKIAQFCEDEADIFGLSQSAYYSKLIKAVIELNMDKKEMRPPTIESTYSDVILSK